MTIIRFGDRLDRLERRLDPRPDPRYMVEVRQRILAQVEGVLRGLEVGPPTNIVGQMIADHGADWVEAALAEVRAAQARVNGRG